MTTFLAGMRVPRAVRLAADASANPQIRSYVAARRETDLAARPIYETLSACRTCPPTSLRS